MDIAQFVIWLVPAVVVVGFIASLCDIISFIAKVHKDIIIRNIIKLCITGIAFFVGAILAAEVFSLISSITPNQPFACAMGAIACKSANPFYFWGEMLFIGVFMLVGGGVISWGVWLLVKRF